MKLSKTMESYLKSFNNPGYQVRGIERKAVKTAYTHGTVLRTQKALRKRGLVEFFGGYGKGDWAKEISQEDNLQIYLGLTPKGENILLELKNRA